MHMQQSNLSPRIRWARAYSAARVGKRISSPEVVGRWHPALPDIAARYKILQKHLKAAILREGEDA